MHSFTVAIGLVALAGGVIGLACGFPPAFVFLIWGVLIVAGTVFERVRYKPIVTSAPGGKWIKTEERFFDENNRPVTVWLDPDSGERKYVAD